MLPGIHQFDLTGRAALITGGTKGLGLAMAEGLASAGADVMLVGRSDGEDVARRVADMYHTRARFIRADVTVEAEAEAMAAAAMEAFGRIDLLINSAGINIRGPIEDLPYVDFKKVMEVNVAGTWLACRAVVPHMKRAGRGRIVNMASALGLVGLAQRTPYASSKGAIVQMTRTLALELAPFGIGVNAICPGPFLTDMNIPIANTEDGQKFVVGATALKRWGELKEIQGAAIFLASDASSYMVGAMLSVDGGWTAQ
jgi:gluconate 5-dehydrogenase